MRYAILALGLFASYAAALPLAQEVEVAPPGATGTGEVAEKEEIKFGYTGNEGPKLWPDFCQDPAAGQSPIDIRPGSADLNPGTLAVQLQPLSSVKLENKNGDDIKFTPAADAAPITFIPVGQANGAQEVFTMQEFHVHTPSEHTVNGKFFDAELHMVFKSEADQIAVVAAFMQISQAAPVGSLSVIEQALPLNGAAVEIQNFDLSNIAAAANQFTGFFTYTGSLTTPPCSPNVLWHVMKTPIEIPVSMALALRDEQGFNARFSQVARDEVPVFNAGLVAAPVAQPVAAVPPPAAATAAVVPPPVAHPAVVPPPVAHPAVVPPPAATTAVVPPVL